MQGSNSPTDKSIPFSSLFTGEFLYRDDGRRDRQLGLELNHTFFCCSRRTMWLNSEQVALTGLMFQSYVMEHHRDDILQILHQRDEDTHYSLVVNAMTLFEANMEVAEYFNALPGQVLSIFDEALHAAALAVSRADARPKRNLHVRVSGKATD